VRRRALSVLAVGLLVAAFFALWPGGREAKGAVDPKDVKLVLQWRPQAQFAGYYAGLEKGFYARRGLNVIVLPGGPDVDPIAEVREGRADFATAFLSGALSADETGAPLVNVCQVINRSSLMIVARKTSVTTRNDLEATRVSLWGSSFQAALLAFFSAAGVDPRIVPQYYTVNLFLRGGVQACAAMEYNEYHTIIDAGVDPDQLTSFKMRDYGLGFPEDGVYTLASTQKSSPGVCDDVAAATLEGWSWCRDHPEQALDIVMRQARAAHVPTNRVHQQWMLEHVLASIFPGAHDSWQVGKLSRVDYERTRAIMIGEEQITKAPSYERFVAPEARGAP
jgi:NitT/TauT family transport system substrate-binding protein